MYKEKEIKKVKNVADYEEKIRKEIENRTFELDPENQPQNNSKIERLYNEDDTT